MNLTSSTHEQEPAEIIVAAENGEAWAQNWLGVQHLFGTEVAKDLVAAAECFRKAAVKGDMDAQSNLGGCYWEGVGVEQDSTEAEKWFRAAAEQGQSEGQAFLGWFCETNGDLAQAVALYQRSAEQGNATAQNNLAVLLFGGNGVPQNYVEAYKWYSLAAAQGLEKSRDGRDIVAKEMTREQIAEGQRRAAEFSPMTEPCNQSGVPDAPVNRKLEAPDTSSQGVTMDTKLTHLIERLETFEDRCAVRIEAAYAKHQSLYSWVVVKGELHPRDGVQLTQDTEVTADVYDLAGHLVGKDSHTFRASNFYGFEPFSLTVLDIDGDVSKIRLYPKPG
jgi:hypothetical protein